MKELLRSNDLIRISWVEAVLREAGIEVLVLDAHASVLEGSGVAIPRRVMVADEAHGRAEAALRRGEESEGL
ncbi:MAG: DUF2007 domain-containing protein [Rhodovibrionaceae bacterium]